MKNFNLMQIIPALESGGVEQGTIDVCNYLAEKEIKNVIISNGGKLLSLLDNKYVSHYKLPVHSKNFIKMPFIAKKINKILQEKNINILHIRSRAPSWLLPYIDYKNIKTISTFHNVYGHQNIFKKIYNKQLSRVNKVIAISEYVKDEIIKNYDINPNKVTVINRGTDTFFFNSENISITNINKFIFKYKIDTTKKIILFPGRLTEWKGQIEFLKVVDCYKDKAINFIFVGDKKNVTYFKKLDKKIKENNLNNNCRILGNLNKEELKMMYSCSDIIVSAPNKPEGFGRIISETLSMKKIILAYNFGGAKNQLDGLDSLYKITPFKFDELIKKISLALMLSNNDIEKMGKLSRDHIINNFSKESMLSSYYNFYGEI